MVSLASRVARLENRRTNTFIGIMVHGGLPEDIGHAIAGTTIWERSASETIDSFVERVSEAARSRGETLLVIGGLP